MSLRNRAPTWLSASTVAPRSSTSTMNRFQPPGSGVGPLAEELARHGYRISPGTPYPTLHKMEAEGLLHSRWEVVAGGARRSYLAAAQGRRALAQAKEQLRELARELLGDPSS